MWKTEMFPDTYTVKARIFPAILATLPVLVLAAAIVSWQQLGISHVVVTGLSSILLYALSDLARRRGKSLEDTLYHNMGGKPSTSMLRHRDSRFDAVTKERWCKFLASRLATQAPSAEAEARDPTAADAFYASCGDWLREHTRDRRKFKLIFEELVTYGFRRNLLGLKWPALIMDVLVLVGCLSALWFRLPFSPDDTLAMKLIFVLVVAACHALYFILAVNEGAVMEAANQYARQLLLGCEVLMTSLPATPSRKRTNESAMT
mgnify:CR=1 FL=1